MQQGVVWNTTTACRRLPSPKVPSTVQVTASDPVTLMTIEPSESPEEKLVEHGVDATTDTSGEDKLGGRNTAALFGSGQLYVEQLSLLHPADSDTKAAIRAIFGPMLDFYHVRDRVKGPRRSGFLSDFITTFELGSVQQPFGNGHWRPAATDRTTNTSDRERALPRLRGLHDSPPGPRRSWVIVASVRDTTGPGMSRTKSETLSSPSRSVAEAISPHVVRRRAFLPKRVSSLARLREAPAPSSPGVAKPRLPKRSAERTGRSCYSASDTCSYAAIGAVADSHEGRRASGSLK